MTSTMTMLTDVTMICVRICIFCSVDNSTSYEIKYYTAVAVAADDYDYDDGENTLIKLCVRYTTVSRAKCNDRNQLN